MNMKTGFQKICGIMVMVLLIGLDRLTKMLAVKYLKDQAAVVVIPGVFQLQYLENTGAAFGVLQGKMWLFYLLTVMICAVCLFFYFRVPQGIHFIPMQLTLILLVSGAVGNFIDRISVQYVVDFLYFCLIDFPIFNVADIYVTAAACMLIVFILFFYSEEDLKEVLP